MSTLLAWRMQEARGSAPSGLDSQALRKQNYGLIDLANNNKDGLMNQVNIANIQNNWGAPAKKIPVRNQIGGVATAGSMTCTFPMTEGDVGFVTVTFLSANSGFKINPRLILQTQGPGGTGWTIEQDTMYKISETERILANLLESQIYTIVNAAKATTSNSAYAGAGNLYPFLADALQVSLAQRGLFFNDMDSIFMADDFDMGDYEIIGDANMPSIVSFYGNQGGANNTNTQFQFAGKNFTFSRSVTTSAAALSTGFMMKKGSVGMFSQVSPDARMKSKTGDLTWDTYASPLLGIDLEVMSKVNCSDESANTGNTLDTNSKIEQWQMGYNVAIITAYAPETNGGIKKFDFLKV